MLYFGEIGLEISAVDPFGKVGICGGYILELKSDILSKLGSILDVRGIVPGHVEVPEQKSESFVAIPPGNKHRTALDSDEDSNMQREVEKCPKLDPWLRLIDAAARTV